MGRNYFYSRASFSTSRPARSAVKFSKSVFLEIFAMKVPPVAVYLKCRLCKPGPAVVSFTCVIMAMFHDGAWVCAAVNIG